MTLSSIAWGCSACEAEEEKDAVKISIEEHKGDIKGNDEATLTIICEGFTTYGDLVLGWSGDAADFETADGKPLSKELHTLAGKKADDEVEERTTVKVKVAPAKQNDTADKTLKLAVGTTDNPNEYASEKTVVSWKATPAPATGGMEITPSTITGTSAATCPLKNNTGAPVRHGDLKVTIVNHDKFKNEHGIAFSSSEMKLHEFLSTASGTTGNPDATIAAGATIDLIIRATDATITANNEVVLSIALGTDADLNAYMNLKPVVTWKQVNLELTPSAEISGTLLSACKLINNTGAPMRYGDILLVITNHAAFKNEHDTTLGVNMSLDQIVEGTSTANMLLQPGVAAAIDLKVRATDATIAANTDAVLGVELKNANNSVTYKVSANVVTWKQATVIEAKAASGNITEDGVATFTLKKTAGPDIADDNQVLVVFGNGDEFILINHDDTEGGVAHDPLDLDNAWNLKALLDSAGVTLTAFNGGTEASVKIKIADKAAHGAGTTLTLGITLSSMDGLLCTQLLHL